LSARSTKDTGSQPVFNFAFWQCWQFWQLRDFMAEVKNVTITVDGKQVTSPAGTLLIEACKAVGIEVPSFCYYPGLSLQAACRMCLVRIEKNAQAADCLHCPHHRWHGRSH